MTTHAPPLDNPVSATQSANVHVTSRTKHYPALDGLRGAAILLVLGHHFRFLLDPSRRLEHIALRLLDVGWCGVELFFVLSGFLITGILLDAKSSAHYFRNFYARRALRIFPLYYSYVIFVFVGLATWWVLRYHTNPWKDLNPTWYLFYAENFKVEHMFHDRYLGHLWSLAIEEQFYLIWPLVVFFSSRSALGFCCATGAAAALISRLFLAGNNVQQSFYLNTLTLASLDSLCMGALVAVIIRTPTIRQRVRAWIGAAAVASMTTFMLLAKFAGTLFIYSFAINTWGILSLSVLFACGVYWIAGDCCGPIQKLLAMRGLRELGKVSYAMYVLHPLVIAFIIPRLHPIPPWTPSLIQIVIKGCVMVLLAAATYLAALLSWNVLEKRFLRLKVLFQDPGMPANNRVT